MNADKATDLDLLTERVLGAVFEVSNTLGAGFLEKVYERALLRELGLRGIRATPRLPWRLPIKAKVSESISRTSLSKMCWLSS